MTNFINQNHLLLKNSLTERDEYIDIVKGIAILSVIFIHTVFWSGSTYGVPQWLQSLSLLIDVPIFFLMSGCAISITGFKSDIVLKQLYKLSLSFTLIVLLGQLIFWDFNMQSILDSIMLQHANIPQLMVVDGSYWFVPTYAISLIAAGIIIRFQPKLIIPIIVLCFVYYFLRWKYNYNLDAVFLGKPLSSFYFFMCLMLLGYRCYKRKINHFFWWFTAIASLTFLLYIIFRSESFSLQSYKFPLSFVYVIASMISVSLIFLLKDFYQAHKKISSSLSLQFLSFLGRNSLNFYMSQGISSSLLYTILPHIKSAWSLKCACAFLINAILAIIIGILLQKMMGIIHHQVEIFSHIVLKYIKNICYIGAKDATN